MKLFIDSRRSQPDNWARALSDVAATLVLGKYSRSIDEISIGDNLSEFKQAIEIIKEKAKNNKFKDGFIVKIHSKDIEAAEKLKTDFDELGVASEIVEYGH